MLKILCLGNNTVDTDNCATQLASKEQLVNYGLIDQADKLITACGVYHTSLNDLTKSDVIGLAKQFDKIVFFNQPIETYDSEETYYNTKHVITLAKLRLKKETETINA